ncbi:MAG TPA: hypothetical protein VH853_18120 [Polyangia bacterium]|nr:hypothetical protein [Polyangia bacterium]
MRTAPAGPGRVARGLSFDQLAIGLLFVGVAVLALFTPAQPDTFWHLRAGADIWRTGQVPRVDLYSHTAYGTPWPDHEWLSQVLMFAAYRAGGGMAGLEIGAALLIVGAALASYRLMVGPQTTRFAIMLAGLAIASSAWSLRPQLLTLFMLPALVWLLARERYLLVPPFFLLWANAHGGVALGGVVLGVCVVAAALRWLHTRAPADRRRAIALAVVLPLAGLAVAATPLGFHIYRFVVASAARSYEVQIAEWFVLRPDSAIGVLFWAATIAFAVLVVVRRRAIAAGDWTDWVVVAAGLALLPLGIRSARNIGPFLILAMPAASRALGPTLRLRLSRRPRAPSPDHPRLNLALLLGLGAAALLVVAAGWRASPPRLYWNPFPAAALSALDRCPGPLYNFYSEGGSLVWFAPGHKDFVDGRQDPFPFWLLRQSFAVEHGAPYRPLFDRFGVRCAFVPATAKVTAQLGADGWHALYTDDSWAVLAAPETRAP